MRGRKPKPTTLKVMAGNPGKRRLPRGEPKPQGLAVRPAWLGAGSVLVWDELAPGLERVKLLTSVDAEQFGMLCELIAEFRKNPAGMVTSRAGLMKSLFAEFGMGPSARTRISVGTDDGSTNEDRFFGPKTA